MFSVNISSIFLIASTIQLNSSVIGKLGCFSFYKNGIKSSSKLLTLFVDATIIFRHPLKKS
jgi:hypothetical protein